MSLSHAVPAAIGRRFGIVAIVAALVATGGDLLLLWVANAARIDFPPLPYPPRGALPVGAYLGVLAIPLFGVGYWEAAAGLAAASPRTARMVFLLGAYGSAIGAVVHGLTGLVIHVERHAGAPGMDPLTVTTPYRAYLLPLWGVIAVLLFAGSVLYALTVARGRSAYPRWLALCNPALLIIALGVASSTSVWLRAFLLPAAPNVAHVIFFTALALQRGVTPQRHSYTSVPS